MYNWAVNAYFPGYNCINVGVCGDNISKTVDKLQEITETPDTIFLIVGTNDSRPMINMGSTDFQVKERLIIEYSTLINKLHSMGGDFYFFSLNPINSTHTSINKTRINLLHKKINNWLINEMDKYPNGHYIDSFSILSNDKGDLKNEYSVDGLHINEAAYKVLSFQIHSYIR